jgi:uncharacterized protein DUF6866
MPESIVRDFHRLIEAVQRNCDISDAQHAGQLTMCNYLLAMRELYCWENELPLTAQPSREDLGCWLTEREAFWNELESSDFEPLPLGEHQLDPFDTAGVNAKLIPEGFIYGSGYGRFHQPQFFLGRLLRREVREGMDVLVAGCEYARGLAAPPAAYQNGAVFLRQEALRRWLWEKIELWGARRPDGALKSALECYGFDQEPEAALATLADSESEAIILHEMGEGRADGLLGPSWKDMLASFHGKRAEILARAVRDNLADCLSTLPALLAREAACSIHFYFANFDGLRRQLFPMLASAYGAWRNSGDASPLGAAAAAGREHWLGTARRLMVLHEEDANQAEVRIEALLEREPALLQL